MASDLRSLLKCIKVNCRPNKVILGEEISFNLQPIKKCKFATFYVNLQHFLATMLLVGAAASSLQRMIHESLKSK